MVTQHITPNISENKTVGKQLPYTSFVNITILRLHFHETILLGRKDVNGEFDFDLFFKTEVNKKPFYIFKMMSVII